METSTTVNPQINKVTLKIFESDYTISGEMEDEYIRKLANCIDEKMREFSRILPRASERHLAVLAALNIADELFQTKEEIQEQYEGMPPIYLEKTKKLINLLEEGLVG
ncbi:MAG: cell division protein ZapA [Spirochaetota bacterium]